MHCNDLQPSFGLQKEYSLFELYENLRKNFEFNEINFINNAYWHGWLITIDHIKAASDMPKKEYLSLVAQRQSMIFPQISKKV